MPGEETPDTTAPSGAAAGGTTEGGSTPAGTPASGGKGTEPAKADDVTALKAENERLAKELDRARGKAGTDKASLEARVAQIEADAASARAEADSLKREKKANATADSIVAGLPEPNRALARAVIRGYSADGIDLAADDSAAITKSVLERLGKEFPHLTKPPETRATVPRIGAPQNGQPKIEAEGLTVRGVKVV
jgi:hypothetical protein